jgi:hypothetical protein
MIYRRFTLRSRAFVCVALLGGALADTNPVSAQQVTLVSSASDGTPGTEISALPSISADGRFVAFVSAADNLVPNDTNLTEDVFVKDRLTGTTTRVSVTSAGQQMAQVNVSASISGDGRFVMFHTRASLVPEDTNLCGLRPIVPCLDVYVHDRQTSTTTRVSVSSTATQGNNSSWAIDISADGRFVLFVSEATNFVPNDTNGQADLFLRDRQTGTTTRVSVDRNGNELPSFTALGRISADSRFIVYGPGPAVTGPEVGVLYVYERESGAVSVLSDAFPPRNLRPEYVTSRYAPTFISDDGRFVAVHEEAPGAPPIINPPNEVIFLPALGRYLLHDRLTGHTIAGPWDEPSGQKYRQIRGLSGDGRTYALSGLLTPVVLTDRVNGLQEMIPTTELNGAKPAALSADGRFTAFMKAPPNDEIRSQIYVYDRDSGDGDGMPGAWETTFGLNPGNLTDANADPDLDGVTNLQEYLLGTHPTAVASATRYFAEGAANAFFTTRLAAVNPGDDAAAVVFRFLGSGGQTSSVVRTIAARSRITLELSANGPTPGNDFSTVIESDRTVVVDRTMTWDSSGYGAHTETSLAAPATTWHLAEGATHGAFDLFYLLQNPNNSTANVTINYLRQAPFTPISRSYTVEPNSRKTIPVDGEGPDLEAVDVAAAITSDLPIVVERAMYSTRPGQPAFAAGHGAAGVTAPAQRWFLAEGATGDFFDLYVLVSNPNTTASALKVTYLLPAGAPFEKTYSVGPQQRLTINVHDEDARLANTAVSVIVESTNDQPVVVERAMWWPKGQWHEAHVSAGATTTGTSWALADGEVTIGGDTFILIANTSTTAGSATVTLLMENGAPIVVPVNLPASSRVNVPVSEWIPPVTTDEPRRRFGALIVSNGVEIVVERAIYTTAGGITWGAGTAALGTKLQ